MVLNASFPNYWPMPTPMSRMASYSSAYPNAMAQQLVAQLGLQTYQDTAGMIHFNEPLIQQIVRLREGALPALAQFLQQRIPFVDRNPLPIIEALRTAEILSDAGVFQVKQLYEQTSHLNTNPNPLLQIYLAGFYRKINQPETFGPMLSSLMNYTLTQYTNNHPHLNPTEEVGGTVLSQIAKASAAETVKQLLPYLNTQPHSLLNSERTQ